MSSGGLPLEKGNSQKVVTEKPQWVPDSLCVVAHSGIPHTGSHTAFNRSQANETPDLGLESPPLCAQRTSHKVSLLQHLFL